MNAARMEAIRRRWNAGFHIAAIARDYRISVDIVRAICLGKPLPDATETEQLDPFGLAGVAKRLCEHGFAPHVVHANFCDAVSLEQCEGWSCIPNRR